MGGRVKNEQSADKQQKMKCKDGGKIDAKAYMEGGKKKDMEYMKGGKKKDKKEKK